MIKQNFSSKQPVIAYSSTGNALICVNEEVITRTETNEFETVEITEYLYDTIWVKPLKNSEEAVLVALKDKILEEITEFDVSDNVNCCFYGELPIWLSKDTRVALINTINIEKSVGKEVTTLWLDSLKVNVSCDEALQFLSLLELYAKECYNITALHKNNVSNLTTIEEVCNYDYKAGYPDKLHV